MAGPPSWNHLPGQVLTTRPAVCRRLKTRPDATDGVALVFVSVFPSVSKDRFLCGLGSGGGGAGNLTGSPYPSQV